MRWWTGCGGIGRRFHHLVAQARAADDQDRALVLFEQALGLWRGEPFAGLDTAWVNALREALERGRFAVELDRTDLHLRRGQHGWLLSEIASRAGAHPLDERVAGQLMLALYQCGRQAEALEHFQRLRVRLVEGPPRVLGRLGISPERIPTNVDAQAGLYRSLLTNRHVLVVLDNARDAEQVRPLLPASPTFLVVITAATRGRL